MKSEIYKECQKTEWTIWGFMVFIVAMTMAIIGFNAASASAAGGSELSGSNLGGSFYPSGFNGMPSFGSSYSENGMMTNGSFWLNLDASTTSLSSANWSFYTSSNDTSRWTATCYLHGLRNSSTALPQNNNWSQSYANEGGISLSANTNLNGYSLNGGQIDGVLAQIASLQSYLNANPTSENAQTISLQIELLQIQVGQLQASNKQVLGISGNFNVSPSVSTGSNFSYRDTTDNWYSWLNGYEQDPVITQIPSWTAEYYMYGQFVAPTMDEARAMGAQFAQPQSVPEPGTFVLLAIGIVCAGFGIWRKKR